MTHACTPDIPPLDLDGIDEVSLRLYEIWGSTLHLQRQLALRIMPGEGLHPGQARCLRAVSANDGISQRDLAEALHLARPTVTAMLQRLEKAGLVERRSDEDDQRLTRITVTAAGRELNERMGEFHRRFIESTVGHMTAADRDELERLFGVLRDNMTDALAELDSSEKGTA